MAHHGCVHQVLLVLQRKQLAVGMVVSHLHAHALPLVLGLPRCQQALLVLAQALLVPGACKEQRQASADLLDLACAG